MGADLQPRLERFIRDRDFAALRGMLENLSPVDLASLLVRLGTEDQVIVFRLLPRKLAATVFEYLDAPAQGKLLKAMAHRDVAALLNDMAPDDRTHLLEELPASVTKQMLALLTPEERAFAVSLLGYPEDSIGRLMTPDYVRVREDRTVGRVLEHSEVGLRDWWRVMRREALSGLALGTILGAIGFLRIALWSAFFNTYGEHWFGVGLTVGLAPVGIVLRGTLVGSMLPFVLRRFGLDPAASSAPFVATLADVTGLIIYFSVAIVILRGTLL